ncbi:MAG: DAK2 domain-containing protein [Bacilli bacterium]
MIKIDGVILKQMIISGSNNLYNSYPEIDNLNVFPVPDGDTGTNMNLTMSSGAKEVFNKTETSISLVAKDFARGLLMGARGNSGVILSQIFRGFAEGLEGKDSVDALGLANAFVAGKNVAYKAVMRPVEGTILTVIREASAALYEKAEKDMPIDQALDILYDEGMKSLARTPDLLPVLKEVGVVDSGGAGLCKILEGFSKALHNEIVEKTMASVTETNEPYSTGKPLVPETGNVQAKFAHKEFGYCTQFLIQLPDPKKLGDKKNFNEKRFKAMLEAHGNSIVCVRDSDLVKVHVHTLKPGNILTYAQQFGEFKAIKVDNMSEQHEELMLDDKEEKAKAGVKEDSDDKIEVTTSAPEFESKHKGESEKPAVKKEFGLIAVAVGSGVEKLFQDLSVDYIVSGGQTMNPSTADFVDAIKKVNAKNIFIFPNNGNIVMAAQQASDIMKDAYNVAVVPTKTIPEGLVACMVYNPGSTFEDNLESMKDNVSSVKSGEITYAIKDTTIDGVTVGKGKFMGIFSKKIVCCHKHKLNTLMELLSKMIDEDSQIITVICGQDVTEEEKKALTERISDKYGDGLDLEIEDGDQPVYSFFVSVE